MTGFPRLAPGTFCSRKRQLMLEPSEQDTMPRQAALSDGPAPAGRTGEAKRTAQEGSASPRPVPPGGSHCLIRSSSPDKSTEKPHPRPLRPPGIPAPPLLGVLRGCRTPRLPDTPDQGHAGLPEGLPGARHSRTASSRAAPSSIPRPPGLRGAKRALCPTAAAPRPAEPSQAEPNGARLS